MKLYHGTNTDIQTIDLTKGLQYKDFGKGFYLTPDRKTAIRMATKKSRLFGGTDKYLDQQYYFGTYRALYYLKKLESETI